MDWENLVSSPALACGDKLLCVETFPVFHVFLAFGGLAFSPCVVTQVTARRGAGLL